LIISGFTFLGVWGETLHYGHLIGGQRGERTVDTPARTDAVTGPRTSGGRVAVGVARSTDGRVVAVFRRGTSRHACDVRQKVTTCPAVVRALSQPISNKRTCTNYSPLKRILRHKKLSCCREAARCFVSLNILLSHSSSFTIIRNACGVCKILLVANTFASNVNVTLKSRLEVTQDL